LLDTVCGKVGTASRESLASIKDKKSQHGFYGCIRIGAIAKTENRTTGLLLSMMSAFRQFETAGVRLVFSKTESNSLNQAKIPFFMPLRLSIAELAGFVLLPCTNGELAGVDSLHPKTLRPPLWLHASYHKDRKFAESLGAKPLNLNIPIKDSLEHTVILGPTGSGKSTTMLNLIMADIKSGRSVLVVDPKNDLINDILARVPIERADDVVVIDPSDTAPVGLNPFIFNEQATPTLISDCILSVFQQVFKESWGVYSQDVLSASLLTLANTDNSTLLQLSELLTNEQFRHSIVNKIKDKHLSAFWASFEAMSKSERQRTIAPVMNKLRQFTMRPALRNMLGQPNPKFNLSDLFTQNKIVLVPLNKGIIGAESAKLIGSLIVGLTWTLALNRANTPAEKRLPVSVFIDELQDYLALPCDFSDALAQARGLGVGFTVAHQYRSQLTSAIKSAIDSNARNKIIFGLNATDAKEMAAMSPELDTADFMAYGSYRLEGLECAD
jgi:type IV secretory pathway TraG/TraD family ATPase VirD4